MLCTSQRSVQGPSSSHNRQSHLKEEEVRLSFYFHNTIQAWKKIDLFIMGTTFIQPENIQRFGKEQVLTENLRPGNQKKASRLTNLPLVRWFLFRIKDLKRRHLDYKLVELGLITNICFVFDLARSLHAYVAQHILYLIS